MAERVPGKDETCFDSRRRLQAGGIRAAKYLTLNQRSTSSSLVARTRICPLAQMVASYREAWTSRHGFFWLNLAASRGCPYRSN